MVSWNLNTFLFGGDYTPQSSFDKVIGSLGSTPHPVTVTTRIVTFLVGNPYKPSFVTVTGWGVDPKYSKSPTAGIMLGLCWRDYSPKRTNVSWKLMVRVGETSYWNSPFLGDKLVSFPGVYDWKKTASSWWFQICFIFTPIWGNDPIWLAHIFQVGWFNHQLVQAILEKMMLIFIVQQSQAVFSCYRQTGEVLRLQPCLSSYIYFWIPFRSLGCGDLEYPWGRVALVGGLGPLDFLWFLKAWKYLLRFGIWTPPKHTLGGGFKYVFGIFTLKIGAMIPIWRAFF